MSDAEDAEDIAAESPACDKAIDVFNDETTDGSDEESNNEG